MAYELKIGGVAMPAPKAEGGLVETYEQIWSANTGRNDSGTLVGTLVATKTKLKLSWNALSWSEAAAIRAAIHGKDFVSLSFPSVDGTTHTVTGYFGTPTFSHYSWADGLRWATAVSVDFIEK